MQTPIYQTELSELHKVLTKTLEAGLAHLHTLNNPENATYSTDYKLNIQAAAPTQGMGYDATLAQFKERLAPCLVAASGARYWGFVTGGTLPEAIAGDWLTSCYDPNAQAVAGQGDVSAQIEQETIAQLLDLFGLAHADFTGGFVTGATMSNFTCLAVARQWLGEKHGIDIAKAGLASVKVPMPILTATPHASSKKALAMLGLGSQNIIYIATLAGEGSREAIDIQALEQHILTLGGRPFIVIASAGTVNTVDFDDFVALKALKQKYDFWLHIDAAFGAFAALTVSHQHLLAGWEAADSITIDCHKWFNVPYENAVFFVKNKHVIHQVNTFQNSHAPYLGDPNEQFNYLNRLPENSRRLKALPVWFALQSYGKAGMARLVESNVAQAQHFANLIESSEYFTLLAPMRLNTVCFTTSTQANVGEFLTKLNATKQVFMTPTNFNGHAAIRAAFVNFRTQLSDVDTVFALMESLCD